MSSNPTVMYAARCPAVPGWLIAGLAAAVVSFAGCGGGGGSGGGGLSISDFSNTFQGFVPSLGVGADAQQVNVNLFPDSASQNKPSGSFDASISAVRLYNGTTGFTTDPGNISGTFSGTTFVINVTNPPPPIVSSYSGHFSDADTIVMTDGGTTLTLRRNGLTFIANAAAIWTGKDASGAAWTVTLEYAPGYDSTYWTFLVQGSELLGGVTSDVTGYVSNRYIELHIARAGGEVVLTGQFPESSGTVNGDLMEFDAGGSLMRPTAAAFSLRSDPNPALFIASGPGQKLTRISSVTGSDRLGVGLRRVSGRGTRCLH
jgi:hypothetical protein